MILLDTHVLSGWQASRNGCRPAPDTPSARHERRQVLQSPLSRFGNWMARENGGIQTSGTVESFVRETAARVILIPITPEIAALAVRLPTVFPKDPPTA